jgi:hypothetical protein
LDQGFTLYGPKFAPRPIRNEFKKKHSPISLKHTADADAVKQMRFGPTWLFKILLLERSTPSRLIGALFTQFLSVYDEHCN